MSHNIIEKKKVHTPHTCKLFINNLLRWVVAHFLERFLHLICGRGQLLTCWQSNVLFLLISSPSLVTCFVDRLPLVIVPELVVVAATALVAG